MNDLKSIPCGEQTPHEGHAQQEGWCSGDGLSEPRLVIDMSETKGGPWLADWLRHQAHVVERESAGGIASVADDMRLIASKIDRAYA